MNWRRLSLRLGAGLLLLVVLSPLGLLWSSLALRLGVELIARLAPGSGLQIGAVEGNFGEGAVFSDLKFETPTLTLTVNRLSLQLDLPALFQREIHWPLVAAGEVRLALAAAQEAGPPLAQLPPLPVLPVGLRLDEMTIARLEVMQASGEALRLTRVRSAVRWPQAQPLEVQDFSLSHGPTDLTLAGRWGEAVADRVGFEVHWRHRLPDDGFVQGSGRLDGEGANLRLTQQLVAPLQADLDAALTLPAGAAPWRLALKLPAAQTLPPTLTGNLPAEIEGSLEASGGGDQPPQLQADFKARLADWGAWTLQAKAAGSSPEAITVERVRLTGPQGANLQLGGSINATARTLDLVGDWRGLQWPLEGVPRFSSPRGRWSVQGGEQGFRYSLDADSRQPQVPEAHWSVAGTGDATHTDLAGLELKLGKGRAQVTGAVVWRDGLELDLKGAWQDLTHRLPDGRELHLPRGSLTLKGSPAAWAANTDLAFKFDAFPAGQLAADVAGSTTAAQVKALKLKVAEAGLSLVGEADWQAVGPRWRVQAEAHDFNPGWFAPEWPGSLSFQLASAGTPQAFNVDLSALSGSLRQHPLEGAARISRRGAMLEVPSLALRAGGGELTASGGVGPGQSLAFALKAPDLKALWPEGAGAVDAKGRVSGSLTEPAASGELHVRGLTLPAVAIASADASWDLDWRRASPQSLSLEASALQVQGQTLDHLSVALSGVLKAHTLALRANTAGDELQLDFKGALATTPMAWQGALTAGRWTRRIGPAFALREPAELSASPSAVRLALQCWQGAGELCAGGEAQAKGRWRAELRAEALALDDLPKAGEWQRGSVSGDLVAAGDGAVLTALDGQLSLSALEWSLPDDTLPPLAHRGITLKADTADRTLRVALDAALSKPAALPLQAAVTLHDGPWDLRDWESLKIDGRLSANAPDLAPWAAYTEEVAELAGHGEIDLQLTGTLSAPVLDGGAHLLLPSVQLTRLGIELKDLDVRLKGGRNNTLLLDAAVRSGVGTGEIHGTLSALPKGLGADLRILSEQLQVVDLPMASAMASARLELDVLPDQMTLKGEVNIPEANLTIRKTSARTERSDDVVVTDDDAAAIERATGLDSDLWLRFGEKVKLDAMGLTGQLAGQLHLLQQPGRAGRASGELRIEDGHYAQWGQDLTLKNSRVVYAGQLVSDPGIEARAERVVGDVTAGVRVSGRLLEPTLKLYSSPAKSDADVLSYLIAGQPLSGASSTDANAMMAAAASLGLRGGGLLTERIAHSFGLDEVKVAGNPYDKNLALSVGKYISPRLYVGYGMGLVDNVNTFLLRYKLSKRWNVEAETGDRSSADLLYTIER